MHFIKKLFPPFFIFAGGSGVIPTGAILTEIGEELLTENDETLDTEDTE